MFLFYRTFIVATSILLRHGGLAEDHVSPEHLSSINLTSFNLTSDIIQSKTEEPLGEGENGIPKIDTRQEGIATIEVAIVCCREYGEVFHHNRQKILNHFTTYFWEMTMRFGTLRSSKITFRITSLTVIETKEQQPFIEDARDPITGKVSFDRILPLFRKWIYVKMSKLKNFDVVMLVTHANLEWVGGKSAQAGVCRLAFDKQGISHMGAMVMDGTLAAGPHELAHLLGAPHDEDLNWCKEFQPGYIMDSEVTSGTSHFFSNCTDKYISEFIRSRQAACLRKPDKVTTSSLLDTDYDGVIPPTISDQCQLLSTYPNAPVRMTEGGQNKCGKLACRTNETGAIIFSPMYNTNCGNGHRCFQGKCVQPGTLLFNKGSGQCLSGADKFAPLDNLKMGKCPGSTTPFDRFIVIDMEEEGKLIMTPIQGKPSHNDKMRQFFDTYKCLTLSHNRSDSVILNKCNESMGLRGWDMIDLGNEEFLISHKTNGKCIAVNINDHKGLRVAKCDAENRFFRWKFELVFPLPGMCSSEDKCEADLRANISFERSSTKVIKVNLNLNNHRGVAIGPGILASWRTELSLVKMSANCLTIENENKTKVKCKLGRLLKENETAFVASLFFNVSRLDLKEDKDLTATGEFKVVATTASKMTRSKSPLLKSDISLFGAVAFITVISSQGDAWAMV